MTERHGPPAERNRAREIVVGADPRTGTVYLAAVLDCTTTEALGVAVDGLLAASARPDITLDLSSVTFVDAAALGAFVVASNSAEGGGGALRVVGAIDSVRRVFTIGGLGSLLAD